MYFSPNATDAFEWKVLKMREDSLGFTHYESFYLSYQDCKEYKKEEYIAGICKALIKNKILERYEFADILIDDAYFWSEALEYDRNPGLDVNIFNKWGQETKSINVNVRQVVLFYFEKMEYCSTSRSAKPCKTAYVGKQYNIF